MRILVNQPVLVATWCWLAACVPPALCAQTLADAQKTLAFASDVDSGATTSIRRFTKHVIVAATRGAANSVVANDWDQDGHVDVISSYGGQVVLLKGPNWEPTTLHTFQPGQARRPPRAACIHSCLMDADGDGDLDFVGSNQTVFWLECPDAPFDATAWNYRTVDDEILGTHCLITGDVNQDGQVDLIANSFQTESATPVANSIVWLEVPSNPHDADAWTRHVFARGDAPGGSHYMGFGDVNHDGRPDITCGAKGGEGFPGGEWFAWWEQPENPKDAWPKHLLADDQPGASNIEPVDVDQDGQMDLVATRGHGHGILWFRGPDFTLEVIDSTIDGPHSLATADMDGDGDIDLATCGRHANGIAAWYENNGAGGFTRHELAIGQSSYDMRVIDMDADGDLDWLIAGHLSHNLVWIENGIR
ncbi:MAG: VCBS repeat-containing protein [Planctomycetota bacterium]